MNTPQYRCPKCASAKLEVQAKVWCRVIQFWGDKKLETDPIVDNQDHEWDEGSNMICNDCQHLGFAAEFCGSPDAEVPIHTVSRRDDRTGAVRWDCIVVLAVALGVAAITLLWGMH